MPLRSNFQKHTIHRKLLHAAHVMGPTLVALAFAGISSGIAHAQGTMDFSGAQTLMSTFKTFAMYAGAVICLGGLIFAGIRMMSGRFQDAIPGLFGALFGAGVLGWGAGWIGIDYGYAVDTVPRTGMDRILMTGDAAQLAKQQEVFARLSPHLRDLAVYTSDSRELGMEKAVPGAEIAPSLRGLSVDIENLSPPSLTDVEKPSFGLGLRI